MKVARGLAGAALETIVLTSNSDGLRFAIGPRIRRGLAIPFPWGRGTVHNVAAHVIQRLSSAAGVVMPCRTSYLGYNKQTRDARLTRSYRRLVRHAPHADPHVRA